jgi:hypothetical protein
MRSFARWSWIAAYTACAPVDDTATTGPTEHCGAITADEAWSASGNPHVLTCTVSVDGAVLTIEAGVQVDVQRGDYELRVAESGAGGLVVAGTAEAPVRLVPANGDDAWHSLSFFPGASPATLTHVAVDGARTDAGANDFTGGSIAAWGAVVTLDHVTITRAETCGVYLGEGGLLAPESAGLVITGGDGWPVCTYPSAAWSLPADGSDYVGNADDRVAFDYKEVTVDVGGAWRDLGVPYLVTDRVELCGSASAPADLVLEAGVRVELLEDTDIKVGVGDGCSASLTAVGRADAPVVFASGDEAPVAGAWGGILIADGAVGTFDYVEIGHGGKDYFYFYPMQGALDFYGASGSVDHTFVHDAACYALDLKDADVIVGELTGADNGCADVNDQG